MILYCPSCQSAIPVGAEAATGPVVCTSCQREVSLTPLIQRINCADEVARPSADSKPRMVAGFWIRLLSDVLDTLFLGIVGLLVISLFGAALAALGDHGVWIGLLISFLYVALLQSSIGRGQTLAKRLLKIQVLRLDGGYLRLPMSLLRYATIALISYGGRVGNAVLLVFPALDHPLLVTLYVAFLLFLLLGCVVLVPLHPLKRGIHDLIARSIVVYEGTFDAARVTALGGRGSRRTCGILLSLGASSLILILARIGPLASLESLGHVRSEVARATELRNVQVGLNVMHRMGAASSAEDRRQLIITGAQRQPSQPLAQVAQRVAQVALYSYPDRPTLSGVTVRIVSGVNLGIASSLKIEVVLFDREGKPIAFAEERKFGVK